jgi:hypothetical protein
MLFMEDSMAAPLKHDVSLDGSLVLHPKVSWLPFVWDRPLALMADGSVVTVDDIETHRSADDGVTWRNAQIIDLGGQGHHGGVMEAAIEQLKDGRVWMLIRTNWGRCWEAFSYDDGLTWREIRPSAIEASTSPATIRRLQSGRLMLIWNRLTMEGKTEHALYGGDGIATEVAVSNQRRELSIAFSEDEGATFTKPVVLAALPDSTEEKIMLAYPRVMEYRPGEVWVTSMQGGLHCRFLEADFVG